jgi:hypothetical protein
MGAGVQKSFVGDESVSAVITICSGRKSVAPPPSSTSLSLSKAGQTAVQAAWIDSLSRLPALYSVDRLYAGRGFRLAQRAAAGAGAKLYVLSAGLGLVDSSQQIPTYGLTVSPGHSDSVSERVQGDFDPAAWFSALLSGPYSTRWANAFDHGQGRVLIALTRPYAKMIGSSLLELPRSSLARLRIFGASLSELLPKEVHCAIMPYDKRLDAITPGTRADFSQRALHHFVWSVASQAAIQDCVSDGAAVRRELALVTAPQRSRRPRQTDEEILRLIRARLKSQSGSGRILRALRDLDGVACEQSRFSRLFRAVVDEGKA